MAKLDSITIEKYQLIISKDPNSLVFAPLAESYREMNMHKEAEKIARSGVKRHPQFVSGLVTLSKILKDLQQYKEALLLLKQAISLAPENILAQQLCGEIYLAMKEPKEALKSFKMVLFMNPQSKIASKAVQKLESLTADEYDSELFQMERINTLSPADNSTIPTPQIVESSTTSSSDSMPRGMERMLSLLDAYIVRNDLEKAQWMLQDCKKEFGQHPEVIRRQKSLKARVSINDENEDALPLKPLINREQANRQRKLETLNLLLRKIEDYRAGL